ncbi:hypothetical protein Tco_0429726 [Tanacetum coccineum]
MIALEKQQPDHLQTLSELLRDALLITLKDHDYPFVEPPPHDNIVSFIKKLGYYGTLDQVSKMHVIKLDAVHENLKFANKGEKDPIYGMAIPKEMMSDEIKASANYSNYLAKSMGTQPGKSQGKRLITKKGIEVVVEKKKTIRIPRKKRTKTVIEETGQSKEIADEEEGRLNERQIGLVMGRGVNMETYEETLDHSTIKLKGFENVSSTAQFLLDMKEARKASKDDNIIQQLPKGLCEGSSVVSDILDDQESQEKSDDERTMSDKSEVDAGKKQAEKIQALKADPKKKKSEIPPSPSQTLSSVEYGTQLTNDNVVISMNDIMQDPVETEIQTMVEVPIHEENPASKKPEEKVDADVVLKRLIKLEKKVAAMSKIDHTNAVEKSLQANVINEVKN